LFFLPERILGSHLPSALLMGDGAVIKLTSIINCALLKKQILSCQLMIDSGKYLLSQVMLFQQVTKHSMALSSGIRSSFRTDRTDAG
jgi:hypothetical protein